MWILQNNIWKEEKYDQMLSLLNRYGLPYEIVNLKPFSESIDLPCDPWEVEMVFGSIRFVELAAKAGVKIHFNDNFNFNVWGEVFGEDCLNFGSEITTAWDLNLPLPHDIFIRPVLDDKSFSGTVLRAGDTFAHVQFATSKAPQDIVIQVAPVKVIFGEYRFFIVNGEVITGSTYRIGSRVHYQNADGEWEPNDPSIFVRQMVEKWQPSDMFVIDIASTPDGFKIVEFGSMHHCGFYDINLSKLIQAIHDYNRTGKRYL